LVVAKVARPKAVKKLPVVLSEYKVACALDAIDNTKLRTLHFTAVAAASGPLCLSGRPDLVTRRTAGWLKRE
jgi:hypothetical protein